MLKSPRKPKVSNKDSKEDSVQLLDLEEIVLVGKMPRMMIEVVEKSIEPFGAMLAM